MEKKQENKYHFYRGGKIALTATLISFFLLMFLYCLFLYNEISDKKERYGYIARNEAEHVSTIIDCVMARTNTLKAMVQDHNGDTSWFNNVAEDIYIAVQEETGVSLKNFAIAPNGVVTNVYPLPGNESLVGFDFLDTTREGNEEAKEAYEKGRTILTNPFKLIQGDIGMGGRAPVIIKDGDKESLWGLVTVTIDFENLIEVLALDNLQGMGVDFRLSCVEADGSTQTIYELGDPGNDTVKAPFNVRNLTWVIEVAPTNGWISVWRIAIGIFFILVISGFIGTFASMLARLRTSNALLEQLSYQDGLTGCGNRRAYEDKIHELTRDGMAEDLVYVSADVNGLKHVNDTQGHLAGDELLVGATVIMQKIFGPLGDVYRIGGDEFAALIKTDDAKITQLKEDLTQAENSWKGNTVKKLSFSIGFATHREFPGEPVETLILTADRRMYSEKRKYHEAHPM
ncbi:MAG: sensor domain-containing diguanylate cyclase [Lachnospiraceae bacterium]|nr:sensor domain-containing diguanylate cyclase [Lachnospiraceae bacterium]